MKLKGMGGWGHIARYTEERPRRRREKGKKGETVDRDGSLGSLRRRKSARRDVSGDRWKAIRWGGKGGDRPEKGDRSVNVKGNIGNLGLSIGFSTVTDGKGERPVGGCQRAG